LTGEYKGQLDTLSFMLTIMASMDWPGPQKRKEQVMYAHGHDITQKTLHQKQ
jgi:hypothetical protein